MPINPIGLTRGLLQRIKEYVGRELGWTDPHAGDVPHDEHEDPDPRGPATSTRTKRYRIQIAARTRMLLWMKYNGTWRHVEPYSYRDLPLGPAMYGWCHLHKVIEAYYIDEVTNPKTGKVHTGIQDVHITDRPFNPRWDVAIG